MVSGRPQVSLAHRVIGALIMPRSFSRREVTFGAWGTIAFRNDTLRLLKPLLRSGGDPTDEAFFSELRRGFAISSQIIPFNNIGLAPSPRAVLELMERENLRAAGDPSYIIWRQQDRELDAIRSELAEFIGSTTKELALMPNATCGLQTVIMGLEMKPGDEILVTSHEYPRIMTAIRQRVTREKVRLVEVELGGNALAPDVYKKKVLGALTSRTKLAILSQISYLIGQILPDGLVDELSAKHVTVLIDGAQSIGLLKDRMPALGAPMYVACLHKWLMGPIGTGIMHIDADRIPSVWPLHPADKELESSMSKFEQMGTHPTAPFLALRESIDLHQQLGFDLKFQRIDYLRRSLARHLIDHKQVRHYGDLNPSLCFPMLTVGFDKAKSSNLAGWLMDHHGIHVTTAMRAGVDAIRISPGIFTSIEEIDTLGKILAKVAQDGI